MKSVHFNYNAMTIMETLRLIVIEFLSHNGMNTDHADKSITAEVDNILLNFNCANSAYSAAIGLLILLLAKNKNAYIVFRPIGIEIGVNQNANASDLINYIKEHMEVKITY